jgi:hypothetical protein
VYRQYLDQACRGRADPREFKRQFTDAHQRKCNVVLVRPLDRFSREGGAETLHGLERLTSYGINWRSFTEQYLDSCGIFKDAVLAILAVIAKQERVGCPNGPLPVGPAPGSRGGWVAGHGWCVIVPEYSDCTTAARVWQKSRQKSACPRAPSIDSCTNAMRHLAASGNLPVIRSDTRVMLASAQVHCCLRYGQKPGLNVPGARIQH